MAHCVLAQWVIVTKLISQYLKNILLIQDKDKKRSAVVFQLWSSRESTVNGFHQFFVKKDKISGISSTKLTMAHGMCYSLFGNGVCNGAISIMQHCFIND